MYGGHSGEPQTTRGISCSLWSLGAPGFGREITATHVVVLTQHLVPQSIGKWHEVSTPSLLSCDLSRLDESVPRVVDIHASFQLYSLVASLCLENCTRAIGGARPPPSADASPSPTPPSSPLPARRKNKSMWLDDESQTPSTPPSERLVETESGAPIHFSGRPQYKGTPRYSQCRMSPTSLGERLRVSHLQQRSSLSFGQAPFSGSDRYLCTRRTTSRCSCTYQRCSQRA